MRIKFHELPPGHAFISESNKKGFRKPLMTKFLKIQPIPNPFGNGVDYFNAYNMEENCFTCFPDESVSIFESSLAPTHPRTCALHFDRAAPSAIFDYHGEVFVKVMEIRVNGHYQNCIDHDGQFQRLYRFDVVFVEF